MATIKSKRPLRRQALRLALFPIALAAYIAVAFEEWVWKEALAAMERFGRLPPVAKAENALRGAPAWAAALCFLLPGAALIPFKLAGLYAIAHGHPGAGLAVFLCAKAVGAAMVGRVWLLTEKTLRGIGWIATLVDKILEWKTRFKNWFFGLWAVRMAKAVWMPIAKRGRGFASKAFARLKMRHSRSSR